MDMVGDFSLEERAAAKAAVASMVRRVSAFTSPTKPTTTLLQDSPRRKSSTSRRARAETRNPDYDNAQGVFTGRGIERRGIQKADANEDERRMWAIAFSDQDRCNLGGEQDPCVRPCFSRKPKEQRSSRERKRHADSRRGRHRRPRNRHTNNAHGHGTTSWGSLRRRVRRLRIGFSPERPLRPEKGYVVDSPRSMVFVSSPKIGYRNVCKLLSESGTTTRSTSSSCSRSPEGVDSTWRWLSSPAFVASP
ncbi:unnamed protein product, partial [Amoebophrya sp. A25]|eukprot:GSA25T00022659001.1